MEPRRPEARGSPCQVLKGKDRQPQSPQLVRLPFSTGKGELRTSVLTNLGRMATEGSPNVKSKTREVILEEQGGREDSGKRRVSFLRPSGDRGRQHPQTLETAGFNRGRSRGPKWRKVSKPH